MTISNNRIRFTTQWAVGIALLALTLAPVVAAQGFKWWQADNFIKELALTSEQTRRLEEIFQQALPQLKQQKTKLDAAETVFERLIEKGDPAAMEQINVVEAARAELNKSRSLMLFNMRRVLTRDQWAKFTALHEAAERTKTPANKASGNDRRP